MKKLLLSSIIMFGVCGFAAAQKGSDSRATKTRTQTASSIAPAPQKSATAAQAAVAAPVNGQKTADPTLVSPDIDKAPVAAKATAVSPAATTVNEAGVVETVHPDIQKKRDIEKAAAAKAAQEKKSSN